jgi:hypothetical protein
MTLGHNHIGTEHILLGLIREGEGVATKVLARMAGDVTHVRTRVIETMSGDGGEGPLVPGAPRCFRCAAGLGDRSAYRVVTATDTSGHDPRPVTVVYCRDCGTALGVLPGGEG